MFDRHVVLRLRKWPFNPSIYIYYAYLQFYLFANYLIYISPSVFKLTYSFDDFSVSRTKRRGKYRKKDEENIIYIIAKENKQTSLQTQTTTSN